jgi:hypothetical protein
VSESKEPTGLKLGQWGVYKCIGCKSPTCSPKKVCGDCHLKGVKTMEEKKKEPRPFVKIDYSKRNLKKTTKYSNKFIKEVRHEVARVIVEKGFRVSRACEDVAVRRGLSFNQVWYIFYQVKRV